ncbi:glycosyltransferase [Burkholderia oklahomensis]|uniref:glycosyltransferase n=1 Tax=Burkholderia oklahomensis TaxID=342113 RepID=UPI0005D83D72|nr:glycosyltransferase [Burkholderia oklahomensis]AJX33472.1 S-adenosyl-L-methionine-dependent methyltransferase family protein [Burkholderia oklahomensis C6786]AOI45109.1 hypothetical protein WI23_04415 [Burkholderia oklahomensis C6786]KUY65759.1 hypothetical protein WI23_03590 [Burkholderia oklahomensis C6786]MBI0358837.1 glycosyltransferase [Burkholderia oklahomensis]SUW57328.1 Probable S-adenosylmethionine-dependent methyltransferase MSMEG_2350 [Burkholderia oklahomensis]
MDFTGERYVPGITGEIEMEHYHRYHLVDELIKDKDVLDIACGEGYGSGLMASRARSVIGVDIDKATIEHARASYRYPNLRFEAGSCAAIPLPDRSVDVIVSFETIEHHDQHDEMMCEISRVLREDGILVISSPDKYEYSEKPRFKNPYHVKELYLDEFKGLLAHYFSNVDVYGQRAVFGSLVARLNGNSSNDGRHFWTRTGNGPHDVQEAGLPREPVYFIALASNFQLPEFAPSIFEVEGYIESRIQGVSADYQAEIRRIGSERDAMLKDKDQAWEKYLQQVVKDYGSEIDRIAAERDEMLRGKDAAWGREVERVAAERDAMLKDKDAIWGREVRRVAEKYKAQVSTDAIFKEMVPLVSLVVVNFNGLRFLPALLQSLTQLDYPRYEIVLVDNASSDASIDYVGKHFPSVRIVKSEKNLGFAGGNNLGMQAAKGDLIGLINNDTVVDPGCLRELVAALVRDPKVWAVGSKIVFFRKYVEIVLRSDVFRPSEKGQSSDQRELGLLLDERSAFVGCDYRKPIFATGFWGSEQLAGRCVRWTSGEARLLLPVMPANTGGECELSLVVSGTEAGAGTAFGVELNGVQIGQSVLSSGFDEHVFRVPRSLIDSACFDLLNNVGTQLSEKGEASDRGIYEPDRGQYDKEEAVEALCGAAMLIRRSALERVGLFDSRFFMYYEDADLCWRIRRAGGELRYVPTSVVRHIHTGSSVEWSPMFIYYVSRNHVLIRFKHASLRVAMGSYFVETARCVRACVAWARNVIRGGRDERARAELGLRLRLQIDLLEKIPGTLVRRWGFKGIQLDRL